MSTQKSQTGPPVPTKGTTRHAIRIPDPLWNQARTTAAEHGDNLSEIIRQALVAYVRTRTTGDSNE